jgi:outer membrane biosynthesis protein TonB
VFDEATVRAIRNWRFRPMIKDGQPTEVVHELTVLFRLEREG